MRPEPACISGWAGEVSIAGKPLTRNAAKSAWSTPSPFRGIQLIRRRQRSSTTSATCSKYYLGSLRIVWYLVRYHDIKTPDADVTRILRRNGVDRLPRGTCMCKVHTKRYNKLAPDRYFQMDVRLITFTSEYREKIRRFQYTAIDDATRARALKVYDKHTQAGAINFVYQSSKNSRSA